MAQEIVGIKIQVGGQEKVISSMGEIRKELKSAQFDVLKFSEAFGASSKEAIEAAKRVAQLKDAIGDAKDLVGAFNPDAKFKALSGAVQGVVGGFAALQGALGLVGIEGESVQKTLLKVQSALALSEGLNTVLESIDSFKNLGAVIKSTTAFQSVYNFVMGEKVAVQAADAATTAASTVATNAHAAATNASTAATAGSTTAMKIFRGALIATGIGAIVAAIGLLVANFDKIKQAVLNTFPGLGKFASFIGNLVTSITDFVGVTSEADRALDQLNKTTARGNESIDQRIKILSAQGGKEKEISELSKQRNENEINLLRENLKVKGKLSDEELKKFRELKTDQIVLDEKEKKRVADDLAAKQKKADEAAKDAIEKAKQSAKERAAAEVEAAEQISKLRSETEILGIENEFDAKRKAIDNQLEIDIKQVENNEKLKSSTKTALIAALEKKGQADIIAIVNQEIEAGQKDNLERIKLFNEEKRALDAGNIQTRIEQLDRENALIEMDFEQDLERLAEKRELLNEQEAIELQNTELTEFQKFEIKKKYGDARNNVTKQEVEVEKAAQEAKSELINKSLDVAAQAGALLQQIAGKNKGLAIAGVVVEQAASIGRIISNTGVANAKAIAATPLTAGQPFVAINSISAGLSIASSIASGLKAVQQINSAQPGGGGGASPVSGASAAAPIAPSAPITNTVTQLDNQSIDKMGSATNRAYVVESDVSNSQERIKRINRAARLT